MNPHKIASTSIKELFGSFWRNRHLIWRLTEREVVGRYRGTVIGIGWSFFNPILMLTVYTFIFSVVFKARWGVDAAESRITFALLAFIGIIIHDMFAECTNRAPSLILNNANYVKKVVFPLEILPWVAMGSTLFHAGVSLLMLMLAHFLFNNALPWTALFFPIVISPLVLVIMGVAWFLSALGVYIRAVGHTVGVFTTALLFLSPVFYPTSALPAEYRIWFAMNPLTFPLEESRKVLILGQPPNPLAWGVYLLASFIVAWMGFWWFQRSRRGFADVL